MVKVLGERRLVYRIRTRVLTFGNVGRWGTQIMVFFARHRD